MTDEIKLDAEQLKLIDEMAKKNNMTVKELLEILRGGQETETQGILSAVKGTGGKLDIQTVLMLKALMGDKRSDSLDKAIALKMLSQPDALTIMLMMQQGGGKASNELLDKLIEEQRKTREQIQEVAFGKRVDEAKSEAIGVAQSLNESLSKELMKALEGINTKVESLRSHISIMPTQQQRDAISELGAIATKLDEAKGALTKLGLIPPPTPQKVVDDSGKIDWGAVIDKSKQAIVDVINAAKSRQPQQVQELTPELLPTQYPPATPPTTPPTTLPEAQPPIQGVSQDQAQIQTLETPVTPEKALLAQRISETSPSAEVKPCCLEELPDGSGAYIIYKDAAGNEVRREFVSREQAAEAKKKFDLSVAQEVKYTKKGQPYVIEKIDGKMRPRFISKSDVKLKS